MDGNRCFAHLFCTLFILAAAGGTGCSIFKPAVSEDPRAELVAGAAGQAAGPVAKYSVELYPERGQPTRVERSLNGPLTTQQALKETEALKQFSRCKIELHRPVAAGAVHRMTVEYDRSARMVAPEFDYALQPGDRLIVKEDPTTVLDDMLEQTLGQFNPMASDSGKGRTKSGGFYRVGD